MFELALEQGHAQLSLLATAIATNQQDRVVHPMLAAQDALAMARAISGAVPDGARRLAALELALAPLIAQASITGQSGEAADGCFADTTAPSAGDTIDHLVAQTATSGVARSLPYLDRIQQSFGAHDISQIRMFDDAPARRGAAFLGARAFTYGDAIATGTPLDLHTAAHEAAHVVQQRAGLTPTTTLERHADAVADAVVAGRSAERLLDRVAPSRHRGPARAFAIQRKNEVGEVHGDQDQLGIELDHGTERVAFLIPLTYPQKGAFVADPQLATRLARDIAYAFTRNGHPRFESAAFLSGRAISSLITRDLTTWLASKSLPATNAYLDQRSAALDGLQLLAPLERWLVSQGIGVGTVDWNAILPGLLAVPTAADASHFEASSVERYRTFLLGIANEASRRPSVTGATATAAQLSPLLRKYATALPESELGSTVRTHSEAFLDVWAPRISGLQFVPPGFDLERQKPRETKATLESHRQRMIEEFKRTRMPNLVVQYVRDHWSASHMTDRSYLKHLEIASLKEFVIAHMADDFMAQAKTNPDYRRALVSAAHDQARFDNTQRLLVQAQQIQTQHAKLEQRLRSGRSVDDGADAAIASNPQAYFESASALAAMTNTMLATIQRGGDLRALSAIPDTDATRLFGAAHMLISLGTAIRDVRSEQENQLKETRRDLERDLKLQYADVAKIVQTMWDDAEKWISDVYVPKLKEVAIRILTKNREEIAAWDRSFYAETNKAVAGYRSAAITLRDIAHKLKTGEVASAEVRDHVFTVKDVDALLHAAQTMQELGDRLDTKEGSDKKRKELREALDAFDRTKKGIENGDYPAWSWGKEVAKVARAELGIGEFPANATNRQVFTGRVQATENPFLARAIAGWQFREVGWAEFKKYAWAVGLGLMTIAALLTPGVGAAIVGAIDAAVNIIHSALGVIDAKRALDLALLDPDLKLQKVTIDQARAALGQAKIAFVISVVIPFGIAAVAALIVWRLARGGTKQLGSGYKNLDAAFRTEPGKVQRLLDIVGDTQRLDNLLGLTKEPRLLEHLLIHAETAANVEKFLAKIPDAKKLAGLLEHAGSAKRMASVLDHVADAAQLERLAAIYRNDYAKLEGHLARLATGADKASSAARLEGLIRKVGGLDKLQPLLAAGGDISRIEKLLNLLQLDKLTVLLGQVKSAERLEQLLKHVKVVEQLERLLVATKSPDKLVALLEHSNNPAMLERVLARTSSPDHAAELFKAFGKDAAQLDRHLVALGANAEAGKRLTVMLGKTKDVATLDRLLAHTGNNIAGLEKLLASSKARDLGVLGRLLAHPHIKDLALLERLLDHTKVSDIAALERLLSHAKLSDPALLRRLLDSPILGHGAQLDRLLGNAKIASGIELEKLVGLVDGGARLERLLDRVPRGSQLVDMLTKAGGPSNAARLEFLINLAHGRDASRLEKLLDLATGDAVRFRKLYEWTERLSKRQAKPTYAPPPQVTAHGFANANMPHFLDHTWDWVKIEDRLTKNPGTTFWPTGTRPEQISKYLGEALDHVNPTGSTQRLPLPGSAKNGVPTSGGPTTVGSMSDNWVRQFYPETGVKITKPEMQAIGRILLP